METFIIKLNCIKDNGQPYTIRVDHTGKIINGKGYRIDLYKLKLNNNKMFFNDRFDRNIKITSISIDLENIEELPLKTKRNIVRFYEKVIKQTEHKLEKIYKSMSYYEDQLITNKHNMTKIKEILF